MHCLVFGYGYMGKIRCRALRNHPDVRNITIIDPGIDPSAAGLDGVVLPADAEIPWGQVDAVVVCTPNNVTADLCVEGLARCGRVF